LLKIDWKNAFNEFSRDILFDEIRSRAPGLANFVEWLYGGKPYLIYNDKNIWSSTGTQQGDPLGPFLFCLVQQTFLRDLERKFDIPYQKFFMDDGNLVVHLSIVPALIDYFQIEGAKVGLSLNIPKCEIWAPNLSTQLSSISAFDPAFQLPNVVIHPDAGVIVLGGPVSTNPDFLVSFFSNVWTKLLY
jgi:Reverse transcriptase (RNA-dependent DNA polymerase)